MDVNQEKVNQGRKIRIFDTTLRDGEQSPGCSMHINEKLDVAEALERLGADVIEAGFPAASEGELKAVKEISAVIKNATVAALCRCRKEDIDKGWEAVKDAAHPRLHVFLATSPIHLKYKLRIDEDTAVEMIRTHTQYAKSLTDDVEFSFEDATRTPHEFVARAARTALEAGATTLNFPDTVGYATPAEMKEMISYIRENVAGIDRAAIAVHCHNDLGMAVANSLAAAEAGASQIECTVNGIGERAGNAALEEVVMAIKTRRDRFGMYTDVVTERIFRTSQLVSGIVGIKLPPNKAIVGKNAFAHESGIHQHGVLANKATYEIMSPKDIGVPENTLFLGKHSGKHAFSELLEEMGYSLTPEQVDAYFPRYKELADRKKEVTRSDIDALLSGIYRRRVKRIYSLKDYEVTAYKNSASALISLEADGRIHSDRMTGDGPVDAGFKAINSLTGQNFKLTDYQVHSVSEGKDALGEATVKLASPEDGKVMTGKGISTDVLEASLIAYINATNKLLQEE